MSYRQRAARKVYFIKPIGMAGPIKIGTSASPDGRRSTLQTWSPFPLEIVAEIEGGLDLEARFHVQFGEQHRGREWFDVTAALLLAIEQINAGTFNVDSLPINGRFPRMRKMRDLSFLTPEWRYRRSVESRLSRRRCRLHITWPEYEETARAYLWIGALTNDELFARKEEVELAIVEHEKVLREILARRRAA